MTKLFCVKRFLLAHNKQYLLFLVLILLNKSTGLKNMVKCPRGTTEIINENLAYLRTLGPCASSETSLEQGSEACSGDTEEGELEGDVYLPRAELDVVRADERCPPTTEDEITYLFVNHFLDILLKSWDGTPCLREKLTKQIQSPHPEMFRGEDELSGESGTKYFEPDPPFNVSMDYLKDVYKTRSHRMSKTNETPSEARLSAMCKKLCDSPKSLISGDDESEESGEGTSFDSGLSWKAQVPDEEVRISFQNGAWYNGRVSRRLMDGDGTFFWEDGGSFEGEFINGTATGFGKLQFPNMSIYEGTVYKGFRHGEGLQYMYNSPIMYSGEWWLGKKSGNGIVFYDDPVRCLNFYKGSWANGKKDGFGYRQYPSGSKYIGFWQNGKRHGTGVMFWCNHDIYRGEWRNGLMDGFGEYTWNGFVNRTLSYPRVNTYRGFWEKGKRNGVGLLELTNGSYIETVWVDDEKNGPGAVVCPNGSLVLSENRLFKNDKPALLNHEEEDYLGLLLRNQGFQVNRKRCGKKDVAKLPDQDQLISFMSSLEKARAISIPIHTPVHSLDLGCHVKRLMEQKSELISKKMSRDSGTDERTRPGVDVLTGDKFSHPRDGSLSPEFFSHEEKLLRYSIMINLIRLKECYDEWSTVACPEKPPFQCVLLRIFFWEMLTQGEVPRRKFSLTDIDEILGREESFMIDSPHEPFEKIQLWQFIHFLITISWYAYGRYVYEENISAVHPSVCEFLETAYTQNEKAVLAPAFSYFLQKHIFQPFGNNAGKKWLKHKDLVPFEAMYSLYKKIGEPHSAKQFLRTVLSKEHKEAPCDASLYFEKIPQYKSLSQSPMTFTNELSNLSSQEPFNYHQPFPIEKPTQINVDADLNCFAELGPKGVVKCLEHVCPNIVEDGLIVDMEYKLTFLEFYKVVITCAEILLKNRALKKTQSEIMSNYKRELEEYERLMKEYEKQKEAAAAVTKKVSYMKKTKK